MYLRVYALPVEHIRNLLPAVLRKRGLQKHADASLQVFRANRWLQQHLPKYADSIRATTFTEDRILLIECDHAIAAQECRMHERILLDALSRETDAPPAAIRMMRKKAGNR